MKTKDQYAAERFKQLREELGFTQKSFAELLGIGKTTIDLERGKTKLSGYLITQLMEKFQINPPWLFGESDKKLAINKSDIAPKAITIAPDDKENILMVSAKAAAGYADNLSNQQYYESLPNFAIPLPEFRNASFRGFQVEGESMLGVFEPGDWVIARGLSSIQELNNEAYCVVVFEDGIVVKQLLKTEHKHNIVLKSSNPEYTAINTSLDQIQEIWEVKAKLSLNFEQQNTQLRIDELRDEIKALRKELKK